MRNKILAVENTRGRKKNKFYISGFSLLELIIAMAIIAIVSGALWGNFFTSIIKGRDARRKQDLALTGKSLELFYNDMRAYPNETQFPAWGSTLANPNNSTVVYMQKLPQDPASPGYAYCYMSDAAGSYYKIFAHMENSQDPQIIPTEACPQGGSTYYNYGVSSPNVTP